ncbi:MAG: hypothetical protein KAH15_02340, partial [Candidatus Marinimicrobia bacterium]|nr:hypothetical protein [Candidatus Neomarinimicrobiota bacterium]
GYFSGMTYYVFGLNDKKGTVSTVPYNLIYYYRLSTIQPTHRGGLSVHLFNPSTLQHYHLMNRSFDFGSHARLRSR